MSFLAFDVQYDDVRDRACAGAVVFEAWDSAELQLRRQRVQMGLQPYVPGSFFLRELPCLLPLLEEIVAETPIFTIVIDAHVDLGADRPGLGRHLFEALDGRYRVVGVAKNRFAGGVGIPVLRGDSETPLWVSATEDVDEAVEGVRRMAGPYRTPALLKEVDRLAREGLAEL